MIMLPLLAVGFWSPVSGYEIDALRLDLQQRAQTEGLDPSVADILISNTLQTHSTDTGCPSVDVDVINATEYTFWNVEAKITQSLDGQTRESSVHLPLLPAKSKVEYTVPCIQDSTYSYYGGSGSLIMVDYLVTGAEELDATVIRQMMTLSVDYTANALGVSNGSGSGETLLEAAFRYADGPDLALPLVKAAMQDEDASALLLAHVQANPSSEVAQATASQIKKLKGAAAIPFVDALIATEAADEHADALEAVIKTQCKQKGRAVALWRHTTVAGAVPGYTTRRTILKHCKPDPGDVAAVVEELQDDPARLAEVVDSFDDKMFEASFERMKASARPALAELMRVTARQDHFSKAAIALRREEYPAAIPVVARATEFGDMEDIKVKWVRATWEAMPAENPGQIPEVVAELHRAVAEGSMNPHMRRIALETASAAPDAAREALVEVIGDRASVLDAQKVADAGLDLLAFDEMSTAKLSHCLGDLLSLRACAEDIAADPVAEVARAGGWQASFVDSANALLRSGVAMPEAIEAAQALAAIGFDLSTVLTGLCNEAKVANNAGRSADVILSAITTLDASNGCAASIRSAADSKERKQLLFSILGLLAVALPIPATVLVLKRRYKKVLADNEPAVAAPEAKTSGVGSRLAGLDRVVLAGLAEAKQALPTKLDPIAAAEAGLAAQARACAEEALRTGDVASVVARIDRTAVYVIAFPGLHDQPQAIRRHLGASWPEHAEAMRRAVAGSNGPSTLISLCVFLAPDASEAVLLVGWTDGKTAISPAALVDARGRSSGSGTTDLRYGSAL